ncbi:hypothetical protein GCM10022223_42980 [Kineosporia mesophila]|uniref:Uncharacterized protein n=1 Tax=Kineosporia mesophila TaxID=566012 RepID=A0ABP6ZY50_9ACTN
MKQSWYEKWFERADRFGRIFIIEYGMHGISIDMLTVIREDVVLPSIVGDLDDGVTLALRCAVLSQ